MIQIRRSVFETNSSSTHSLTISDAEANEMLIDIIHHASEMMQDINSGEIGNYKLHEMERLIQKLNDAMEAEYY